MTEAQRTSRKTALEAKRRELSGEIRNQAAELAISDDVHDPVDQVQNTIYRDEAGEHAHRLFRTLLSVEDSLRAISEGSYGYCAECGELMAAKRLDVIPWATHCVPCQTQRESTLESQAVPIPTFGEERKAA
ncbi:MAG TPA: TraR/DksA family transcriptional regulator [Bryobacteraceae bacterium]|nr:TraR/DksA family transcriptional regulator [Bryobacteraceae bacterium]